MFCSHIRIVEVTISLYYRPQRWKVMFSLVSVCPQGVDEYAWSHVPSRGGYIWSLVKFGSGGCVWGMGMSKVVGMSRDSGYVYPSPENGTGMYTP